MYLARVCQRWYCCSRMLPIASRAFDREVEPGSNQQSFVAECTVRCESGGSVPIFRQRIRETEIVFILSRSLHVIGG